MSYTSQEQLDRFGLEIAGESIQKKKDPTYEPSLILEKVAKSLSHIYDVEYERVLRDLSAKRNMQIVKLSDK